MPDQRSGPSRPRFLTLASAALLLACLSGFAVWWFAARSPQPSVNGEFNLTPVSWSKVQGWTGDPLTDFWPAYLRSCERLLRMDPGSPLAGPTGAFGSADIWQTPCRAAASVDVKASANIRAFLEHHYYPFEVSGSRGVDGLITGYFEPELRGSLVPTERFATPLKARPGDLIDVDLGAFRDDLRGRRIAGRIENGRLVPYASRGDIEDGALEGRADTLVWIDDPIDAFFLHIQGSGRIRLRDGSILRVGYAGQNGHPYTAIGRVLIDQGQLTREAVSMDTIRQWMADNPDQAGPLMAHNASYIFFRRLDLADPDDGPLGAEGLPLTPLRSLAVDAKFYPYGIPVFLRTDVPDPAVRGKTVPFQRLMMAQDTGGAIRGAVRGDVFFGSGDAAGALAGPMKAPGRFHVLLPRALNTPSPGVE